MVFWRKKPPKDISGDLMPDQENFEDIKPSIHDQPYLNEQKPRLKDDLALTPSMESEYPEDDEDDEDDDSSSSASGKGGSKGQRKKAGRDTESVRGNVAVGGAASKGDGDTKMTKKEQNKILREASVQTRALSDSNDALDKARSGSYNTLEAEVRKMDGLGLYNFISNNPSHMAKVGLGDIQQTMLKDGYGKELNVLTHGTFEAEQMVGRKAVMDALLSKPVSQMNPQEQAFLWDKLSELGQVSGSFDGNLEALESAIGGFVMSTPAGEQLVKDGRVMLAGEEKKADQQRNVQQQQWNAPKPR